MIPLPLNMSLLSQQHVKISHQTNTNSGRLSGEGLESGPFELKSEDAVVSHFPICNVVCSYKSRLYLIRNLTSTLLETTKRLSSTTRSLPGACVFSASRDVQATAHSEQQQLHLPLLPPPSCSNVLNLLAATPINLHSQTQWPSTLLYSKKCPLHQNTQEVIQRNDWGNGAVPCLPPLVHRPPPKLLLKSPWRSLQLSSLGLPRISKTWVWVLAQE